VHVAYEFSTTLDPEARLQSQEDILVANLASHTCYWKRAEVAFHSGGVNTEPNANYVSNYMGQRVGRNFMVSIYGHHLQIDLLH